MHGTIPAPQRPDRICQPAIGPALTVRVTTPGGNPIEGAWVRIDRVGIASTTDKDGIAKLWPREDEFELFDAKTANIPDPRPNDPNATRTITTYEVEIEAGATDHGPVVASSGVFKFDSVKVKSQISRIEGGFTKNAPGLEPKTAGDSKPSMRRVGITLVPRGDWGEQFLSTPARRLSAEEVRRELWFYVAHGDITLNKASEYKFKQVGNSLEWDSNRSPAITDRVHVANSCTSLAGIEFKKMNVCNPSGVIHYYGNGFLPQEGEDLTQRFLVALIRLCRMLVKDHQITTLLSQGIYNKTSYHRDGRAIDIGGVAKRPIAPKPGQGRLNPKDVNYPPLYSHQLESMQDFTVFLDWGSQQFLIKDDASSPERRIEGDDGKTTTHYAPGPSTQPISKPIILFRLQQIPTPNETRKGFTPPTTAHLTEAKKIFETIYNFAATEMSLRSDMVGQRGDPASAAPNIGSVAGNLFYPDYPVSSPLPSRSGREAHVDHFHTQIGLDSQVP